jgi:TolB-like protein/Flp pilus assembly protein TadD
MPDRKGQNSGNERGRVVPSDARIYRFGDFTLDGGERRLVRDDRPLPLRPKAFETLQCLVAHHGRLVRKETLLNEVWGGACVSEEILTHCVSEVRQALGDDARGPRYVQTVPRAGYRFVAHVEPQAPPATEGLSVPSPARPSLAVLPFVDLSGDPECEYLGDGISEELINRLTKVPGLRVVAHSSSFSFKGRDVDAREIGRQLDVTRILEGSVRRSGDRLRISAQLIDAWDGCHLWAEQYDRAMEDVFVIQDEISWTVLSRFEEPLPGAKRALEPRPPTTDMTAHQLYLKGRFFWHRRFRGGLQKAIDCYQEAIDRDPRFAPAHSGLAVCYGSLGVWALAAPEAAFPRSEELARHALELDDSLAEAHASLAFVDTFYRWNWGSAGRRFEEGIRLNPGAALVRLWNGHYLSIVGRFEEAFAEMRLAQDLDPLSPIVSANLGWTFLLAHQTDRAIEELGRVLALDPDNGIALFYLGYALAEKGRPGEAISAFEKAIDTTGGMPWLAESIAWLRGLTGDREAARTLLLEAEEGRSRRYVPSSALALIHLGLGDDDAVCRWLRRGLEEHDALMAWLRFMPCFDRLRSDRRFQEIARGVGLPALVGV